MTIKRLLGCKVPYQTQVVGNLTLGLILFLCALAKATASQSSPAHPGVMVTGTVDMDQVFQEDLKGSY